MTFKIPEGTDSYILKMLANSGNQNNLKKTCVLFNPSILILLSDEVTGTNLTRLGFVGLGLAKKFFLFFEISVLIVNTY